MLQIDHRESHDIDLFLDDPQLLPFLNPTTQNYQIDKFPDEYQTDGSHVIKMFFENIGEIDFICCGSLTENPAYISEVDGRQVSLETPAEIIAKKIHYRGSRLQPRDMFDIAAVVQACGQDQVVGALRACGMDRCVDALAVADAMSPTFASNLMRQLLVREHNRHLLAEAQSMTRAVLRVALGL
ncbi:nucleotidyl transferase AbiEii/AbiGii toxin family protein [Methylobacterium sp. EM32]|uniref:nucleotidyl transferase AbiEii/AbiGii toxin family protein n=1 Tax=Methylobacterium sp. EM32 TaxID=3163481 RepID=UPI0033A5F901